MSNSTNCKCDIIPTLYPHEHEHLLAALRRDLRHQEDLGHKPGEEGQLHQLQAHHTKRLLEILNPKRSSIHSTLANAGAIPLDPAEQWPFPQDTVTPLATQAAAAS